jgi:hypothetical protein
MLVNLIDSALLSDMYDALEAEGFDEIVKATAWSDVGLCRAVMLRHKTLPPEDRMEGILLKLNEGGALRMVVQGNDGPSQAVVSAADFVEKFDFFLAEDVLQFLEDYEIDDGEEDWEDDEEESDNEDEDEEEDTESQTGYDPDNLQIINLFEMIAELQSLDFSIRNMASLSEDWMEPAAREGMPEVGDLFVTRDLTDAFRVFQLRSDSPFQVVSVSPGDLQGSVIDGAEVIATYQFLPSVDGKHQLEYWALDRLIDLAQHLDPDDEDEFEEEDDEEED